MEISWITYVFSIIGVFLFYKFAKYVYNELRIAPRRTSWQKFKIHLSIFIFSAILTAVILFIAALISSAIAKNAMFWFIRAGIFPGMDIGQFAFPLLLPVILICLGVYIFIYPFFETFFMAGRKGGAMEIQKWIETKIIDKFSPPWSYLIAFLGFLGLYIVPPTIISFFIINDFSIILVFLDWFMLAPIFYLTYYSTIGCSQAWFAGLKANLRKDKKRLLFFIFSIFVFISVIYNLIVYLPVFFGIEPLRPSFPGESGEFSGFIEMIIERAMDLSPWVTPQNWQFWLRFKHTVPIDFILFFITTCLFSILGFYAKFLNKEPLNRPILVVFAAYMVCGIAFQLFGNIIIKWPWAFPDQLLWLNLDVMLSDTFTPQQLNAVIIFMLFFLPAVVADKIFAAILLIYQLFFNKNLRETIFENVLTQAIADNDIEVLKKYTKHKNPRIREKVADATIRLMENQDLKNIKKLLPILEDLIIDRNPNVVKSTVFCLNQIGLNISKKKFPLERFFFLIQLGFATEIDTTVSQIQNVVFNIGKTEPDKVQPLYEFFYKGYLPEKIKNVLIEVLGSNYLGREYPELSYNIAMSMLDRSNMQLKKGATNILKNLIGDFKPKYRQIYDRMKQIVLEELGTEENTTLKENAAEITAYISSIDESFIEEFLNDYKQIQLHTRTREKIIGGLTQIIVSYPKYIDKILPDIINGLSSDDLTIKQDTIMSLGVIALRLDTISYSEKIHPIFEQIISVKGEENNQLKKWSIDTFKFLFKGRTDFLNLDNVHNLLIELLSEKNAEIRTKMTAIIAEFDYQFGIKLLLKVLQTTDSNELTHDILTSLESFLDEQHVMSLATNNGLADILYKTMLDIEYIRRIAKDKLNQDIRTLSIKTICKIAFSSRELTEKSYSFLTSIVEGINDQASAIIMEFFGKVGEIIQKNPSSLGINLKFDNFYQNLKNVALDKKSKKILTRISAIRNISIIYKNDRSIYGDVYELFYNLRREKDDRIISIVISILSEIVCDFPESYFKYQKDIESRWIDMSKLEAEVFPLIYQFFDSGSEEVQEAIINAISRITDIYENYSIIRQFLFRIVKKKVKSKATANAKSTVVNCLTRVKNIELEHQIIKNLRNLTKDRDSHVRKTALIGLSSIMLKMEPLSFYIENNDKARIRSFKRLKEAILRRNFQIDSDISVRKTFLKVATDIAIRFPDIEEAISLIKDYALDKEQDIAILSVRSYFKYIGAHHDKFESTVAAAYMGFFANSPYTSVKSILLKELNENYVSGEDLKFYLPTLLKLATDGDNTIRQESLKIFKEIYEKTEEKLPYFIELLIKLTKNRNVRIRIDAFKIVAQITFEFPKNIQNLNLVFDTFSKLSQDYNESLKLVCASFIEDMIKIFPNKLNNTLRIIYHLLGEKSREIVKKCTEGLRYAMILYPKRADEIKKTIERFYRKSNNPVLQELIREFEK
ncbi:MAG: hypothetical protein ACTSWY_09635 [Promethearchaeota archaeon]